MQLPARQKVWLAGGGILLLGAVSAIGAMQRRPEAPLSIEPIAESKALEAPASKGGSGTPKDVSPATKAPETIVVDVAGLVVRRGTQTLPAGSRVDDAIKAAGGVKPGADLDAINLAAKLTDGEQILVRAKGSGPEVAPVGRSNSGHPETRPPQTSNTKTGLFDSLQSTSPPTESVVVSLNTATDEQLQKLPGVGPVTSKKILAFRQEHGGFQSIEQLRSIKGIGPAKFEKMKPFLRL